MPSLLHRDDSLPGPFRQDVLVAQHVGLQLHLRHFEDSKAQRRLCSPKTSHGRARPSPSGRVRAAKQRRSAEFLPAESWQLHEPLGGPSALTGSSHQEDAKEGLSTSKCNPFEEQDDDPALADRRSRSLSGYASSSGRPAAVSEGGLALPMTGIPSWSSMQSFAPAARVLQVFPVCCDYLTPGTASFWSSDEC